jgi:hypothetical protein
VVAGSAVTAVDHRGSPSHAHPLQAVHRANHSARVRRPEPVEARHGPRGGGSPPGRMGVRPGRPVNTGPQAGERASKAGAQPSRHYPRSDAV